MASMQATTARACWCRAPDQCELQQEALPALKPDDVLVRATHGAVSRGTESLVLAGRVPASEHARMRCPHMGGSFEFPVKYGYVSVGVVEACGKDVEHLRNARVFCLHPHQDAYVVPAADVRVVPRTRRRRRARCWRRTWRRRSTSSGTRASAWATASPSSARASSAASWRGSRRHPGRRRAARRRRRAAAAGGGGAGRVLRPGGRARRRGRRPRRRRARAGRRGRRGGGARAGRRRGRRGRGVVAREHRRAPPARRAVPRAAADAPRSQVGNLPPSKRPRWDYTRRMNLALKLAGDASLLGLGERDAAARCSARRAAARLRRARRGGRAVPPRRLFRGARHVR